MTASRPRFVSRSDRLLSAALVLVGFASPGVATAAEGVAPGDAAAPPRAARAARPVLRPAPGGGIHPMMASRRTQQRFERCRELCEQKKFHDVLGVLQAFLDEPHDELVPLGEKDPRVVSLKAEVEQILCGLPAEARDSYELQFGRAARQGLDDALAGSRRGLDVVVAQYFPTAAGGDAAWRAALGRMAEGRNAEAALLLARLKDRHPSAVAREPQLSFLLAAAALRAGDAAAADRALDALARTHPDARFSPGGERTSFDLSEAGRRRLRERYPPQSDGPSGRGVWSLAGGNPQRSFVATTVEGVPEPKLPPEGFALLTDPLKLATDAGESALDRMLGEVARPVIATHTQAVPRKLPRCVPITVGHRVVVRTVGNIRGLSLTAGTRSWESLPDAFLESLMYGAAPPDQPAPVLTAYVRERLFDDWGAGMLSSDGARVFAVEEGFAGGTDLFAQDAQAASRLVACDAITGSLEWEIGGPPGELALTEAGSFFLGAPLPVAGRLFALAETGGTVRLLDIDPETGRVDWSQPVAEVDSGWDVSRHRGRRSAGLSPTAADGLLVCPMGGGLIVAVDPARRALAWQRNLRANQPPAVPGAAILPNRAFPLPETGWLTDLCMGGAGRVLAPIAGQSDLACLSLADGAIAWTLSPGKLVPQPRFLTQGPTGRFVAVGAGSVGLYRWSDGGSEWEAPVAIATLAGTGFVCDGRLHLPVESNGDGALWSIDLAAGKVVDRQTILKGRPLGNLACAGGLVVSQSADRIDAFRMRLP